MQLSEKAKEYFTEHYGQLIGFTVEGVGVDTSDETGMAPTFCLVMKKGRKQLNVFISADEEGNGPGYLEIETARK